MAYSNKKTNTSENGTRKLSLLSKAFIPEYGLWADKDEFLDIIYWLRQVLGVVMGLIWGALPVKGIVGIVLFLTVNIVILYLYSNIFQRVDGEDYGGMSEILKEGMLTSLSLFLVAWIVVYSAMHGQSL